jgi:hypothetical protein
MHSYRRHAVATGVLFILATVAPIIGLAVMRPVLADPVDLALIAANPTPVLIGALLQFIGYAACPAIALALYPVLRHHGEGLALGSVVFRTIEATFYLVSLLGLLMLVTLAHAAVDPGAPDAASIQQAAVLIVAGRVWPGFVVAVLAFGIGALLYGWLLYRTALVPRWLAGWGMVGAVLAMTAAGLVMLGVTAPMSTPHLVLNLPIFAQEMVLAAWLIARGFSRSTVAAGPATAPGVEASLAGVGATR